jgi:hypothetical protein
MTSNAFSCREDIHLARKQNMDLIYHSNAIQIDLFVIEVLCQLFQLMKIIITNYLLANSKLKSQLVLLFFKHNLYYWFKEK